jgi:hypothetical protein
MLRLIREYGGGVVMAFQDMFCNEMNDNTRTGNYDKHEHQIRSQSRG